MLACTHSTRRGTRPPSLRPVACSTSVRALASLACTLLCSCVSTPTRRRVSFSSWGAAAHGAGRVALAQRVWRVRGLGHWLVQRVGQRVGQR
eukprot:6915399-Prymnesium_polylepis.1